MLRSVFDAVYGFVNRSANTYRFDRDLSVAAEEGRMVGAVLAFPWRRPDGVGSLDILTWRTLEGNPMIQNRRIFEDDGSVNVAERGGMCEVELLEAAKFARLRRCFGGQPDQIYSHPDLDVDYLPPLTSMMPEQIVAKGVFRDKGLRLYVCDSVGQVPKSVTQADVRKAVEYAVAMKQETPLGKGDVQATFAMVYGNRDQDRHFLGVDLFGFPSLGTPNTRIYCQTVEAGKKVDQGLEGITCEQGLLVLAAQAPLRRNENALLDDYVFAELPEGFERERLFEI